jgi:hypothetical protein
MKNTLIQAVPLFLKKDSSDSMIPSEDDNNYKLKNVTLLKYKGFYVTKTKRKLDRIKFRRANISYPSYNVKKSPLTYNRERATSTDSSCLQNCATSNFKTSVSKFSIKKKFHELLDTFKVCELFLSYLTITDVLNFTYVFKKQMASSAYSFLIKKQTEQTLLKAIYSLGFDDERKKDTLGIYLKAIRHHRKLHGFRVYYQLGTLFQQKL